jgi:excisionase family DNA binding protein
MRNSPIATVDPADLLDAERAHVASSLDEAKASGTLDMSALPDDVRAQLFFALDAVARGKHVTAVADGKPLTTTEAAELLGMSRTLLTRLCNEGRVPSHTVGTSLRIDAETVMTILRERGRVKDEARQAVATGDERRLARAAHAAGVD